MSGGPRLKHKIYLSPMAGCTDLAFRRVARRLGCPFAFAEMVKDRPVLEGNRETLRMLRTDAADRPLGVQLVGREPALLREAARRVEGIGAEVVDINLGCPVPKVVNSGCGAALLREPEQVARILEAVVPAVGVPVTVKIRSGFDEGEGNGFLRIAKVAQKGGAAAITVHGRTRAQLNKGMASLEAIRAVKEAVSIPVIGNGGIRTGADARRMVEVTGCDGVMVARGALGNPWIFREVERALAGGEAPPPPTIRERAAVLREHYGHLREFYGDVLAGRVGRKVFHWYVKGAAGSAALRERGNAIETPEQFEELVRVFEESPSPSGGDWGPGPGAP